MQQPHTWMIASSHVTHKHVALRLPAAMGSRMTIPAKNGIVRVSEVA
jgi:hypothetical protein